MAVCLCAVLLAVLLTAEIRRANRSWLLARITANVVAVISLVGIIIPVTIQKRMPPVADKVLVIITEGFDKDSVRQFLAGSQNSEVFAEVDALTTSPDFGAAAFSHVSQIGIAAKNVQAIHLFGEGLPEEDLKQLTGPDVFFHPGNTPGGIQSIYWKKAVMPGEKWVVQGSFYNSLSSPQKLILTGFDTHLDSVVMLPNSRQTFQLTTVPKFSGKAIYSILSYKGRDTLVNEPLPFMVETPQPLRVLLLASSPDFENKFLKNWLAENGYKVAARTAISKNKYAKDFLNLQPLPLDDINTAVLGRFDVLLTDVKEMSSMGRAAHTAIETSIDNGLGLIVTADSTIPAPWSYSRFFKVSALMGQAAKTIRIHNRDTAAVFAELNFDHPFFIQPQPGTNPIFYDQQNHAIAAIALYGRGKVLATTLPNTYEWKLGGNDGSYQQYWSALLSRAAREVNQNENWSAAPFLPYVNNPVIVQALSAGINPMVAQAGGENIYMRQHAELQVKWSGIYWPVTAGWQSFIKTDGTIKPWYAFGEYDFKAIRSLKKTILTANYIRSKTGRQQKAQQQQSAEIQLPPFWFFLLFLLAAAFLWIEKKFL